MAGTDSRFNATEFRDAIRFVMTMGLPESILERATFVWLPQRTYETPDSAGNPFDWTTTPEQTIINNEVQIPVAVEYTFRGGDTVKNTVGEFDLTRIIVTILDTEYPEIFQNGKRADQIRLKDAIYEINYETPPLGLFDVTVYQLHATAIDEA